MYKQRDLTLLPTPCSLGPSSTLYLLLLYAITTLLTKCSLVALLYLRLLCCDVLHPLHTALLSPAGRTFSFRPSLFIPALHTCFTRPPQLAFLPFTSIFSYLVVSLSASFLFPSIGHSTPRPLSSSLSLTPSLLAPTAHAALVLGHRTSYAHDSPFSNPPTPPSPRDPPFSRNEGRRARAAGRLPGARERSSPTLGATPVEVRTAEQLADVDCLAIPGGESTTIAKLARAYGLVEPIRERAAAGMPILGTCAGMIVLADASRRAASRCSR